MFKSTIAGALSLALTATSASAATNLMFVLDASNSMWGQVDGTAKIDTAKTALLRLMSDLPADTKVGLMAYGHTSKTSCQDVKLVLPVGAADEATARQAVQAIVPQGKTPIANALQATAGYFPQGEEENNNVVLISDGIETCDGDPCLVAETLAASNINVKVHVVGFDISEKDRAALECIAEKGNGRYFAANSTEDFNSAVSEAVTVVAQAEPKAKPEPKPEPEPKPAGEPVVHFVDEFDGDAPQEHWAISNENIDSYLVEESALLLLTTGNSGFRTKDTPNLFRLNQSVPKGDWDLAMNVRPELGTGRDDIWLGVYEDADNFIAARLWSRWNDNPGYCADIGLTVQKYSQGQESRFDRTVVGTDSCGRGNGDVGAVVTGLVERGARLVLSKRGRKYSAKLIVNEDGGRTSEFATDEVSVIRLKGDVALAVGQWEGRKGETLLFVDRIEITGK
jgi:Mg-chelatase subunit ChlD